jgi:hypothetical protein
LHYVTTFIRYGNIQTGKVFGRIEGSQVMEAMDAPHERLA